jgi:hypothetical protein
MKWKQVREECIMKSFITIANCNEVKGYEMVENIARMGRREIPIGFWLKS